MVRDGVLSPLFLDGRQMFGKPGSEMNHGASITSSTQPYSFKNQPDPARRSARCRAVAHYMWLLGVLSGEPPPCLGELDDFLFFPLLHTVPRLCEVCLWLQWIVVVVIVSYKNSSTRHVATNVVPPRMPLPVPYSLSEGAAVLYPGSERYTFAVLRERHKRLLELDPVNITKRIVQLRRTTKVFMKGSPLSSFSGHENVKGTGLRDAGLPY